MLHRSRVLTCKDVNGDGVAGVVTVPAGVHARVSRCRVCYVETTPDVAPGGVSPHTDASPGSVEDQDGGSPTPGDGAGGEGHLVDDTLQFYHAAAVVMFLLHVSPSFIHHTRPWLNDSEGSREQKRRLGSHLATVLALVFQLCIVDHQLPAAPPVSRLTDQRVPGVTGVGVGAPG